MTDSTVEYFSLILIPMIPNLRDPTYLGALVFFECAARHLSFSKAAAELYVTPSAVSHRIAALELALGVRLFERLTRRVSLTQEGLELARVARESLHRLRDATGKIVSKRVLRLSIGPYLSTNWLMPRLSNFETDHPGIRVDLLHRTGLPDLRDVDVAIVWTDRPPEDLDVKPLFDAFCVPVSAPGVLKKSENLWDCQLPALHYRSRSTWREWLKAVGGPEHYADTGEVFEDPNLVLEAAAHSRGIAMGFIPFIQNQLASGRLQQAHSFTFQTEWRYWLVETDSSHPDRELLVSWLQQQAGSSGVCPTAGF